MSQETGASFNPLKTFLEKLLAFYRARNWEQFHSPKNVVMDLVSEVGELTDLFRWLTEKQSSELDEKTLQDAKDEIGDVFKAIVYLAHRLGIDPIQAAEEKLQKMGQKYPVEKSYGNAVKYTNYQ